MKICYQNQKVLTMIGDQRRRTRQLFRVKTERRRRLAETHRTKGADPPAYVAAVRRATRSAKPRLIKASRFPPPSPLSPILISVVKNEQTRLADFLSHYRAIGVERFVFLDNGSTDATLDLLAREADVDLFSQIGRFGWIAKQGWINALIENYGHDRWYVVVDADEHIVFEGCDYFSLEDLVKEMVQRGIARVRGMLLDMYGDGAIGDARYRPGQRLRDAFPWFDRDTYLDEHYRERIGVKGGPRKRVFGRGANGDCRPELTKYPLFRLSRGEYMVNPHHIWPYEGNFASPRFLAILHYKFLPDLRDRAGMAVRLRNYWNESSEYRSYLSMIENDPGVALRFEGSERFESAEQLARIGLIAGVGWPNQAEPSHLLRAAFRKRRRGRLAAGGGDDATPWGQPAQR